MERKLLTVAIATNNQGKLEELRALFEDVPVELVRVVDVTGQPFWVVEDGDTFEANAALKARAGCAATGLVCMADDSGLEVEGLAGRPGVRSARFAGPSASDAANNDALLDALSGVGATGRRARFRCVLSLAIPGRETLQSATGLCQGSIVAEPRGRGGFGYDPLFESDDWAGRTMAQLTDQEKNRVSHRARAARALRPRLLRELQETLRLADLAMSNGIK